MSMFKTFRKEKKNIQHCKWFPYICALKYAEKKSYGMYAFHN